MNAESSPKNLSGKKVLVTGGLGFIGSNIAHRALSLGADVTIYDCLDPRSGGNMFNVKSIKNDIQIILNDIRNFEGLCSAVLDQDIIYNCAAYTSHPNAMKEPFIDIDVNCKGVINLLEAARRFNIESKIVHIGTSTQIGQMSSPVANELHPEFPVDIYSANKCASEKYVLVYSHAYKMRGTVIRLANNYGPRSNIRSADFGFMNFFIGLGLKDKDITVFGEGNQQRNVSFIADSVEALIGASLTDKTNGEAYFAASDEQYTVREIATAIADNIGGRVRFVEWPKDREVIEIGDAVIENRKLRSTIDWNPQIDLPTGLAKTREYFAPVLQSYL